LGVLRATTEGARPEEVLNRLGVMLSRRDMALASAVVFACLRHQSRLDFLIDGKLSAGSRTPATVRIILRMGLAQLLFLDRVGHHAVVNETTALGKSFTPGREGLINAILRAFVRDKESDPFWPRERDGEDTPEVERLATFYSYPGWLVEWLHRERGIRWTRAFLAAGNQPAPAVLRLSPSAGPREAFAARLPFPTRPTAFSPRGLVPVGPQGRPDSWPGFAEGHFCIQDEASQLVLLLAAPEGAPRPRRILDVCAGRGGKSFAMLAACPEARVTALDLSRARLSELGAEARRLGLAERVVISESDVLEAALAPSWDLVSVDPPCTGLGVVRRHPDIKWKRSARDVGFFADLQRTVLEAASRGVRGGGRLIYSVCTVTREEGHGTVDWFLSRNADFRPARILPGALEPLSVGIGRYLTVTHRHNMDGFFYAVMERAS
jgi:16S rRNA (cytosine967-C5)-methyltransferase